MNSLIINKIMLQCIKPITSHICYHIRFIPHSRCCIGHNNPNLLSINIQIFKMRCDIKKIKEGDYIHIISTDLLRDVNDATSKAQSSGQ